MRHLPLLCLLWSTQIHCAPNVSLCETSVRVTPTEAFFTDISESSGIRTDNFAVSPPSGMQINDHSRLAFADINGDHFDDMVMHSLFPNPANNVPFEHLVFLNNGDGTFTDFSDDSGLRNVQAGFFAFADMDNDGDQDVFTGLDLDNYASHTHGVYLNNGGGVFTQVENAGIEVVPAYFAATAAFADFNNDGFVDLFMGNGSTSAGVPDRLYFGNGDGTFTDETTKLGSVLSQPSNGSVTCDYDNDGDLDIFVSTYGVSVQNGLNHLWRNNNGSFTEVGVAAGFAGQATGNYYLASTGYGEDPEPGASEGTWVGSNGFGIDCGDVNGDGYLDIFLTTISHPNEGDYSRKWSDPSQLLINQGDGTFVNEWLERDLPFNEGDVDGGLVDFDNDSRLDLSISRDTKYEDNYTTREQKSWFGLMRQTEDGLFESMGYVSGINDPSEELLRMKGAQNHAWSDIDLDGDLDLLVGGRDQGGGRPNFLFRNDIGHQNRWLSVHVEGDGETIHSDAFGTRISVSDGTTTLLREKKSSRGMYNSEDSRRLHFGLGALECPMDVTVRWPDGTEVHFNEEVVGNGGLVSLRYPDEWISQ